VEIVDSALQPGYMNPANVNKYNQAVQLFESNNLPDYAYKYAKIATEFNPQSFDAWTMLYYSQKATPAEKALARDNLFKLDPLNPDPLNSSAR
jgi:hypothetical protein